MRRTVVLALVIIVVIGIVAAAAPRQLSLAGADTPTVEGELCTEDQITRGIADITELPPETAGVVQPTGLETYALYVVVVTLPPGSCVPYHAHQGPISMVVYQGAIEYAARAINTEGTLRVKTGTAGGSEDVLEESEYDALFSLDSGSWVTQNEAAAYTYRNVAEAPAVVALAAYVSAMNILTPTPEAQLTVAPGYSMSIPIVGIDGTPGIPEIETGPIPGCNGGCRKR